MSVEIMWTQSSQNGYKAHLKNELLQNANELLEILQPQSEVFIVTLKDLHCQLEEQLQPNLSMHGAGC